MKKASRIIKQLRHIDRLSNKHLDMRPKAVIEALRYYEVNANDIIGMDFDDYMFDLSDKQPKAYIEDISDKHSNYCGNTYNWCSDLTINWNMYSINGHEYLGVRFHIAGDVRGNYTDYMLLDMTLDEFFEELSEASTVRQSFTVGRSIVQLDTDCLKEGNVFNIYVTDKEGNEVSDTYDYYISDIDTTERNYTKLAQQVRQVFKADNDLREMLVGV